MSFSYEDFLLFTKAPESDKKLFATIIPGVLKLVEDTFGIYVEAKDITYTYYAIDTSTIDLPIAPINTITSITYDSSLLDFTFYGRDILLTNSLSDTRKPLTVVCNVGFANIPEDLKLAVYQHIESVYFSIKNSTDNVEKVVNTSGSTTFFREDALPKFSKDTYDKYSNRRLILY